ncbi:MAG: Holliday junction branch migration protein RuvA [Candidatus Hydrogenedentes bacterium]|nr:Holliday junction branch migration protein RuvA [Candidatus Hydrogenedentota bacterium]HOJ68675.1 Holliday junction branch migration protein RuvA [Candidatus Hydrogenedentota bacterium]
MFAFLQGKVAMIGAGWIALDIHGVGYQVGLPDRVLNGLAIGQEIRLLTYCHIREDDFQVFGFPTEEDRALFRLLLGINGIGPKVALSILSVLDPAAFLAAIEHHDIGPLTRVPGVGKKLAQRVLLEVKTRLGQDTDLRVLLGGSDTERAAAREQADDAVEALVSLGCTVAEARENVAAARRECPADAPVETIIKRALARLARR